MRWRARVDRHIDHTTVSVSTGVGYRAVLAHLTRSLGDAHLTGMSACCFAAYISTFSPSRAMISHFRVRHPPSSCPRLTASAFTSSHWSHLPFVSVSTACFFFFLWSMWLVARTHFLLLLDWPRSQEPFGLLCGNGEPRRLVGVGAWTRSLLFWTGAAALVWSPALSTP